MTLRCKQQQYLKRFGVQHWNPVFQIKDSHSSTLFQSPSAPTMSDNVTWCVAFQIWKHALYNNCNYSVNVAHQKYTFSWSFCSNVYLEKWGDKAVLKGCFFPNPGKTKQQTSSSLNNSEVSSDTCFTGGGVITWEQKQKNSTAYRGHST